MKFKLLITGSRGFIGKNIINEIKRKKISYLILKTSEIKKNKLKKFKDITHILHMGFRLRSSYKDIDQIKMKRNLEDIKVLSSKTNDKTKLIFISTIGVYCFENNYKIFKNRYFLSKLKCERYLKRYCNNFLILRLPNIYGPNNKSSFLIPSILNKLKKNNKNIKINYAEDKRDYIHINDTVKVILNSLKIKQNLILNIFSNNVHSVLQVVKIILKKLKIKNCQIIKINQNSYFKNSFYLKKVINKKIKIKKFIKFNNGINFLKKEI